MTLKFGKAPARQDTRDLLLERYTEQLPSLPPGPLGYDTLLPADGWGMLGNGPDPTVSPGFEGAGDCVWAGSDHETMLWNLEAGQTVTFTADNALADYSAVTGYVIGDESTDQGTDVRTALLYRQKTGLIDAAGARHTVAAFVSIAAGSVAQIQQAIWLFSAVSIGIQVPSTAMDQFNAGQPWSVVAGASIEGGHYVPGVRWDPALGMFKIVTWGQEQLVTPGFLATYCDEAFAVLSDEMLSGGKTLNGFDVATLTTDLQAITA
jgi:hypothetical protein